jgi:hypothetical protein
VNLRVRLHEINKKPGIHYALTDDGVELPIIDVTHPAFTVVDPPDMDRRIESALMQWKKIERMPGPVRALSLWYLARQSILMKNIQNASGTFLSGMATYLAKLGPDNLGAA